jgi:hypothetical protein
MDVWGSNIDEDEGSAIEQATHHQEHAYYMISDVVLREL